LARHPTPPALEQFQRLAGGPVPARGLGREVAGDDDEVNGGRQAGFTEVKELLERGEIGIVRIGRGGVGP